MRNIKLVLEYDGTNYHGWQIQPNLPTIQGAVEDAIRLLTNTYTQIIGAGRTDAGVHADGQVANFHTNSSISLDAIQSGINAFLPNDIVVSETVEVDTDFHARFSAISRYYRYTILNRPYPSAQLHRICYHLKSKINIEMANEICKCLIGKRDFSSFQKTGSDRMNPVCNFYKAFCYTKDDFIYFEFEADSFLRGMVRTIVGTILMCIKNPNSNFTDATTQFKNIVNGKDISLAGSSVPANGLSLVNVNYSE
ncbi:tRNA pseudouridine(38-40) synthase TruA [Candidatus Poribacteria bacterium]|nr:tRNA pseudouridine(38-40) synthase TruA [Candidatus Poribacteria bacterium]